jgi:hypothetical protein
MSEVEGKEALIQSVGEVRRTMPPTNERVIVLRDMVEEMGITNPIEKQMIINGRGEVPLIKSERLEYLLSESLVDKTTFGRLSLFGVRLLQDIPSTCSKSALGKVNGFDDFTMSVVEAALQKFGLNFMSEEESCFGVLDNLFIFGNMHQNIEHFYACAYAGIRDLRELEKMTEEEFAAHIDHYFRVGFGVEKSSMGVINASFDNIVDLMTELNLSFKQEVAEA